MKFSIKIFVCTILVVAAAFSAGGYLLISRNFTANEQREVRRALEEHLSLRYMLESGIYSQELQNHELTDGNLYIVADDIARNLQKGLRSIVLNDSTGREIYNSAPARATDMIKLRPLNSGQTKWHIEQADGKYSIYITGLFTYDTTPLYLSYIRDISDVFAQRDTQLKDFMVFDAVIVLISAVAMLLISWLLTRPIRKLSAFSRRIAGGEYGQRAQVRSSDEIGDLTENFNKMAVSVEDKINELEVSARKKDEFIANFTHELKTPMTSIIGYADMLRSRDCDSQTTFKAANYIFNEGRRLESLSLKMLDLLIVEKHAFTMKPVDGPELLEYIASSVATTFEQDGVKLTVSAGKGMVLAEPDFIKTLLVNIADNARKASAKGGIVELAGAQDNRGYTITVTDHGRGIPESELGKITEAFYMVDKSRSRAQHGAGLGLAIANRIAELHSTKLSIRSIVGLGTSVSISLAPYIAAEVTDDEE